MPRLSSILAIPNNELSPTRLDHERVYKGESVKHLIVMASNLALFAFTSSANRATSYAGWYVNKGAVVDALGGDDRITGSVAGAINGAPTIGIKNEGTVNTGEGNDTITGSSVTSFSIYNDAVGTINTGNGNDTITARGTYGIQNWGTINTGNGNDTIIGRGSYSEGISNSGTINTGNGNDTVDALKDNVTGSEGGFGGIGNTYLGANDDVLKGFGPGKFYGGTGIDKLLLGPGTYRISTAIKPSTGSSIHNVFEGVTMNVNQFEQIGGAKGGLFTFGNGTLTVNAAGVATFT